MFDNGSSNESSMGYEMLMESMITEHEEELERGNAREAAIYLYCNAFLSGEQLLHKTKDGKDIPFKSITDQHLNNILSVIKRSNASNYNKAYLIMLYEMEKHFRVSATCIITYGAQTASELSY